MVLNGRLYNVCLCKFKYDRVLLFPMLSLTCDSPKTSSRLKILIFVSEYFIGSIAKLCLVLILRCIYCTQNFTLGTFERWNSLNLKMNSFGRNLRTERQCFCCFMSYPNITFCLNVEFSGICYGR